jgi:hypothetical protein
LYIYHKLNTQNNADNACDDLEAEVECRRLQEGGGGGNVIDFVKTSQPS